jgi:hypothetical protein
MEISIRPHELAAAADRLAGCARDLDAAATGFRRPASADVLTLGMKAAVAGERGLVLTDRAVRALAADIDRLAAGLRAVAAAYPSVDVSAVPPP